VSGLRVEYSLSRAVGQRVISILVNGIELQPEGSYHVATVEIIAQGGDLYTAFKDATRREREEERFSDVLTERLRGLGSIVVPARGRLLPQA